MIKHQPRFAFIFVSMIILALLGSACAAARSTAPELASQPQAGSVAPAAPRELAASDSNLANYNTTAQTTERIVIKNATLSIVVSDPAKAMDAISQLADEMGGYVVSANLYQSKLDSGASVPRASVKIRVPAERLTEAMNRIKAQSDRIPISENIESQDVTSDYTDLQSRLRNLENTEAQLTKIMDSATKTEDVLSVYNQLVPVREQIEVLKGQIKYYDESAALSAISTELIANAAVQPLTIGGWQPVGVAKSAVQALINTVTFLANAAIWVVILVLPVLLILFAVIFLPLRFAWRFLRRRMARGKSIQPQVVPPAAPPSA
jgi:hypothetical protein